MADEKHRRKHTIHYLYVLYSYICIHHRVLHSLSSVSDVKQRKLREEQLSCTSLRAGVEADSVLGCTHLPAAVADRPLPLELWVRGLDRRVAVAHVVHTRG